MACLDQGDSLIQCVQDKMLLCAAGSIFNDLCKRMFSFGLLFFMEVMELSAADTGLIILIGQIVDALTSVISGYLGDMVKVPVLSQKIGMRKSYSYILQKLRFLVLTV